MSAESGGHVATEAFHILRSLYQLSTDLASSENRQDLIFRILNNTIRLFPYNRAVLWSFDERKPRLLGVSGRDEADDTSPYADLWKKVVNSLEQQKELHVLNGSSTSRKEAWEALTEKTSGLSVLWVPLVEEGTWAWLDISESHLFGHSLPADVVASVFANRDIFLVLANYGKTTAEITTTDTYVRTEAPNTAPANSWTLSPGTLEILCRRD